MYRVLIVDDSPGKMTRINGVIEALGSNETIEVSKAVSVRGAIVEMESTLFDLLILDAFLPMRDGESPRREGGRLVLDTVFKRGNKLKRPRRIVGLTAFEDVRSAMDDAFASQGVQLVMFSESSDAWTSQLASIIAYQIGVVDDQQGGKNHEDVCILTALKNVELEAVLQLAAGWKKLTIVGDNTQYFRGEFRFGDSRRSVIAAAALEMGMSAAACLATKMIHQFRPRYLIMCGITAGVGLNMGDVVVAERSWDYGSGKYIGDGSGGVKLLSEPRYFDAPESIREHVSVFIATQREIVAAIQGRWQGNPVPTALKAVLAPMASGAAVVENEMVIAGIKNDNRKVAAIEMEAYGVFMAARTCAAPRPEVMVAKSVCDTGTPPKSDDFQRYAAFTSAQLVWELVLRCLP